MSSKRKLEQMDKGKPGGLPGDPAIQQSLPYLSQSEIDRILSLHTDYVATTAMALCLQTYSLISAIADELRFPIRTVGTAMTLYHRFSLFNKPLNAFTPFDTAIACLFVSAKLTDCAKNLKVITTTGLNIKAGHLLDPDSIVSLCLPE